MIVEEENRRYPLKRPKGHRIPVPRWTLKMPNEITQIHTLYIGVQSHGKQSGPYHQAERSIQQWLDNGDSKPIAVDTFRVTHGYDLVDSRVWVAYWTTADDFKARLDTLDLQRIWNDLGDDKQSIGVWCEYFTTPIDRLETNYASLLHQPGIAQVQGGEFPEHNLTAYWGAGRDRLPGSKDDLFLPPDDTPVPKDEPKGFGEHLTGTNYDNMCHIRSGQWWTECDHVEREAYEGDLQKTLMKGMQYLWDNPEETGTLGLRFLQNLDANGTPIRETCGAGFHRNWQDLEMWASTHPSHLAIFTGAIAHAQRFGPDKKFMTWHEVSILKTGEASFEYVNCDPKTGVVLRVPLDRKALD